MNKSEQIEMAYSIQESVGCRTVSINDIVDYIDNLEKTGMNKNSIESMVSTMVVNEGRGCEQVSRNPQADEILVYDLPEDKRELMIDPR